MVAKVSWSRSLPSTRLRQRVPSGTVEYAIHLPSRENAAHVAETPGRKGTELAWSLHRSGRIRCGSGRLARKASCHRYWAKRCRRKTTLARSSVGPVRLRLCGRGRRIRGGQRCSRPAASLQNEIATIIGHPATAAVICGIVPARQQLMHVGTVGVYLPQRARPGHRKTNAASIRRKISIGSGRGIRRRKALDGL